MIIAACRRDAPSPSPSVEEASVVEAMPIRDAAVERFADANDPIEKANDEHVARVKSIGHTSVVLRLDMREGHKWVFKPRSKKGFFRYKGEIAAFRLGLMLGIGDNVPKAYVAHFNRSELIGHADERAAKVIGEEVVFGEHDVVEGAKMPWIDDYAVVALENEPLSSRWRRWLKKDGAIPDDEKDLAREISTMILFDFVTGNWDRWSGANVATSKGKLLYVDNDGAFFETPPKEGLARNKRYLEGVDRFSKGFVDKLRALTAESVASAMRAVLSDKAIEAMFGRRDEALAMIANKELYFP